MATLPKLSAALTVAMKAKFVVTAGGALKEMRVGVPGLTVIPPDVPVTEAFTVSVTVMVWLPAVLRAIEKTAVPLGSFESVGRVAWLSELVKCTLPA